MKKNQQALLRAAARLERNIDKIANGDAAMKTFFEEEIKRIKSQFTPKSFNSEATLIRIEFFNPTKLINCDTAKDTYIECIKEFGIERVRLQFPNWIKNNESNDCIKLAPNVYLETGISNAVKKERIEKIANFYKRAVVVTLT